MLWVTWSGGEILCARKAWLSGRASLRQMPSKEAWGKRGGAWGPGSPLGPSCFLRVYYNHLLPGLLLWPYLVQPDFQAPPTLLEIYLIILFLGSKHFIWNQHFSNFPPKVHQQQTKEMPLVPPGDLTAWSSCQHTQALFEVFCFLLKIHENFACYSMIYLNFS